MELGHNVCYAPWMANDRKIDLEGQIKEKQAQLQKRQELLENYARTVGRDRWYNRACHDITTLREELRQLMEQGRADPA